MSTAPGRRFRPRTPDDAASASWRVVAALGAEWLRLDAEPSTRVLVRRWARLHPDLAGPTSLGELLDAIDAADRELAHRMLLALLRVHRAGSTLAGQVIVQAMLPKACSVATSTRGHDPEAKLSEAVAAAWETLSRIDLVDPPTNLPGRIGLDMLHAVTAPTRAGATEVPVDDLGALTTEGATAAGTDVVHDPEPELSAVLEWAVAADVVSPAEADFLLTSRTGGLRPAARQRRSRLTRRLRRAVHEHVERHGVPPDWAPEAAPTLAWVAAALDDGLISPTEASLVDATSRPDGSADRRGVEAYATRHGLAPAQVARARASVVRRLRRPSPSSRSRRGPAPPSADHR